MRVGAPSVLGINYWPRKKAMFWWEDFDAGEVREEFAMLRDLGLACDPRATLAGAAPRCATPAAWRMERQRPE